MLVSGSLSFSFLSPTLLASGANRLGAKDTGLSEISQICPPPTAPSLPKPHQLSPATVAFTSCLAPHFEALHLFSKGSQKDFFFNANWILSHFLFKTLH